MENNMMYLKVFVFGVTAKRKKKSKMDILINEELQRYRISLAN